ncbi:MAG: YaeQ family protein [Halieaceae bacterium]|jgi:uncharacterized protein YaeQ|nr:YaeQ family protein [Halieaceae bacterium]
MALKSTVYKVSLNVADMDRQVYGDFPLVVARHPSETEARMMLRVLAFALHASDRLVFGRGISTDDEPDLWQKSLTGEIELWVELGTPEPERLKKACGRAQAVVLYCYGDRATPVWWSKHRPMLEGLDRLAVYQISDDPCSQLAALAASLDSLQCTIESGEAWFSGDNASVHVTPVTLKAGGAMHGQGR